MTMTKTSTTVRLIAPLLLALTSAVVAAQTPPKYGSSATISGGGWRGGEGAFQASHSYTTPRKNGFAMASLATGSLHASAGAAQVPCGHCGDYGDGKSGVQSRAVYWDTVSFSNGVNMGMADISLTVSGQLSTLGASAWVRWYIGPPKADFFQRIGSYAELHELGSGTTVIEDDVYVPLGEATYFVYAELVASAVATTTYSSYASFGNSLYFNWTLPPGTTSSSASGTFLSASPVPEPASLALMLGGLAPIAWRSRRHLAR